MTDQRIPYRRDKTEDERFFILTLFAIAHEIEAMGQYSGSLMRVQLAVGLPPAHFGVQAKRFINYFNGRGAVAFQFKGKPYAIFIENTACFPQSFSAAAATVKTSPHSPEHWWSISAALRRIMCVCGTVCRTWQPVILWKTV